MIVGDSILAFGPNVDYFLGVFLVSFGAVPGQNFFYKLVSYFDLIHVLLLYMCLTALTLEVVLKEGTRK